MNTCADFCEHLLKMEHTALLPGGALLLSEDDFSIRCSYVDFDGDKTLAGVPSRANEDVQAFVNEHFPLMVRGVENIARYIGAVREGRRRDIVKCCGWARSGGVLLNHQTILEFLSI